MLTEPERILVDDIFSRGPSALFDAGYTVETGQQFISRDDVKERLQLLDREYRSSELFTARLKFATRRSMAPFARGAVAVLAKALVGPTYIRTEDGAVAVDKQGRPLIDNPGPTPTQVAAAAQILDRLGVEAPSKKDGLAIEALDVASMIGQVAIKKLPLESSDLATPEERALSRERVRNAIQEMTSRGVVQAGHAQVKRVLSGKKMVIKPLKP